MEKKIALSSFFKSIGLDEENVVITESHDMYPHKENNYENWSYYTGYGFKQLREIFEKEKKSMSDIAIIGIGSGVEGILATKIFKPYLKNLIITDIDTHVINGAVQNIKSCIGAQDIAIIPFVGSYCDPIKEAGLTPHLIYGNLPNLPATEKDDLSQGAEKGTFIP